MAEGWTELELAVAQRAFDSANTRPIDKLIESVQAMAGQLSSADTIWALHDYLSIERHTIEGRFDFRVEGILFVFASLVKDDLLSLSELDGLAADKLAKISAMSRF